VPRPEAHVAGVHEEHPVRGHGGAQLGDEAGRGERRGVRRELALLLMARHLARDALEPLEHAAIGRRLEARGEALHGRAGVTEQGDAHRVVFANLRRVDVDLDEGGVGPQARAPGARRELVEARADHQDHVVSLEVAIRARVPAEPEHAQRQRVILRKYGLALR
jgi:hypothetical protein